jgi:hypothetical protein
MTMGLSVQKHTHSEIVSFRASGPLRSLSLLTAAYRGRLAGGVEENRRIAASSQTDGRAPKAKQMGQPGRPLSASSGERCGQNFHPVVVPSGVLSWGHIRASSNWNPENHGGRIVIQGTKLSPAVFLLSLPCFGRSRRRPALLQSQKPTSAQRNAGCAASMSRRCRSFSRSSTKCCESKQNSTYSPRHSATSPSSQTIGAPTSG